MEIKTSETRGKDARVVSVEYPIKDNLQDNVTQFGDKVVNDLFVARAKVKVQDIVRPMLKASKSDEEIQTEVDSLKLDEKRVAKKSNKDKALDAWNKMSPEERAEFKRMMGKK